MSRLRPRVVEGALVPFESGVPRPPVPAGLPPVDEAGPALADVGVVAVAALTWAGAAIARPVPLWLGLAVAAVAFAARRPGLLLVAALLLGSNFGARAVGGLGPVSSASYSGAATLVSDPVALPGLTRADVRVGSKRLELRATGAGRGTLSTRLAGERITVVGRMRPPPPDAPWLVPRHVVGRLDATAVEVLDAGGAPWRAANQLRRALVGGSTSMTHEQRSLFTGLVLGDDRDQSATLTDDFRGSGLSHLLAVSGQNVAFVLALVGPGLRRLRLGPRWAATVGVVAFFALVTRFEPSVIRAGAMAGVAATAFALGRPASGLRLLALAVTGLVLVDPLLTRSVGFQLSVAASAGILVIAPALARWLPGPAVVVQPLAVTAGAQLAVAPLLITTFGGLPVASLPANLLAGPAAGLVMMWGLAAGLLAGVMGAPWATWLHLPTRLGIDWIAGVARAAARAPLGELGVAHLLVLAGALAVGVGLRRFRGAVVLVALAALLAPAVVLRGPQPLRMDVSGGELWRSRGATVLVVGGVPEIEGLLEALRRAGVRRLDLVAVVGQSRTAPATVAALRHRWPPGTVWAADAVSVPGSTAPPIGHRTQLGSVVVEVTGVRPGLAVAVDSAPEPVPP